ncbi:MAG: hypothetical protein ACI4J8_09825 [Oscillospiraceae bacterium]
MNKREIKSAYSKITLPSEFKESAREKLSAMAKGTLSASDSVQGIIEDERPLEIKPHISKHKPLKVALGLLGTAAAVGLFVGGGLWIKANPQVLLPFSGTPSTSDLSEPNSSSTDTTTSQSDILKIEEPPENQNDSPALNLDLLSELGMSYNQIVQKYGSPIGGGKLKGFVFEKGYGRYGWKHDEEFEDMRAAGGCNMIDGVSIDEMFTGLNSLDFPLSVEEFSEIFGFDIISCSDETGMDDCYSVTFSLPLYENVVFVFSTTEKGIINTDTSVFIELKVDSLLAKPVITYPEPESDFIKLNYSLKYSGVNIVYQTAFEEVSADSYNTPLDNYAFRHFETESEANWLVNEFSGEDYIGRIQAAYSLPDGGSFCPLDGFTFNLDNSFCSEYGDCVILCFNNESGAELYIKIAKQMVNQKSNADRLAETPEGTVFAPSGSGLASTIVPYDNLTTNDPFNIVDSSWFFAGAEKNGVKYLHAGNCPTNPTTNSLVFSASGMSEEHFTQLVITMVQGAYNERFRFAAPFSQPRIAETFASDYGELVFNEGSVLGVTNAGKVYNVENSWSNKDGTERSYTEEDLLEFSGGNEAFSVYPLLNWNPDTVTISYKADYKEFTEDMDAAQCFMYGRPLPDEPEDERFMEAHKYFDANKMCYTDDRLSYFDDKTPVQRIITQSYYSYADGDYKSLTITGIRGTYNCYLSDFVFSYLPAQPSADFLSTYTANPQTGDPTYIYAGMTALNGVKVMCGGFYIDGMYYIVNAENISESGFADVLANLYIGAKKANGEYDFGSER